VPDRRSPLLVVMSGPSGVGKDSIIRRLRSRMPDLHFAVTATTRPPREGEVPGKSYFFVTQEQYHAMLDGGALLAPANVHGHWYGAPLEPIRRALHEGRDVLLKIDVQGAIQVRRRLPQAVFMFVAPSSLEELIQRLQSRHTESKAELERRVRDARFEMEQLPHYDYVIVNRREDLDDAVDQMSCIVTAERLRAHRQPIELSDH
jgi:guanylate kinase